MPPLPSTGVFEADTWMPQALRSNSSSTNLLAAGHSQSATSLQQQGSLGIVWSHATNADGTGAIPFSWFDARVLEVCYFTMSTC
jgi:hypothetical protein